MSWNGHPASFVPGTGGFSDGGPGIHAVVGVPEGAERIAFSFPLALNGSGGVYFTPFGRTTEVDLASDYAHPSFQGNWLPAERTVSDASFTAKWSIPYLGRNYPQAWKSDASLHEAIAGSRFGVELFILLTFAAVWLIEVLAGVRVHPIQYLLLGSALCLFYLLELSLSEHIGFLVAYALASVSVIALVAGYCSVVLRRGSRAGIVATGVALLYAYLYTLLMNEDFALLAGSVGLFAILAAIMYATRRVDWYAVGTARADSPR